MFYVCRHFEETNHTYAMQLDNKRVWDYAGDNYVHRIIQSKGDGKLVEFDEGRNTEDEEKLDSITLEVKGGVHLTLSPSRLRVGYI